MAEDDPTIKKAPQAPVAAATPEGAPQSLDPYARTVNPGKDVTSQILSTPGPEPTWPVPENAKGNIAVDGLTFGEIGTAGLRMFGGYVREEILAELQGRQGAQKYREMGDNSSIIGAVMFAIEGTMRKVEWRVIPNDDAPAGPAQQMADFVESCMNDMSHTWEDLIVENISSLQYGYAVHEIVYKRRLGKHPDPIDMGANQPPIARASSDYDDGLIGWRRMPLRKQDTIYSWFMDAYGIIKGVRQLPYTGIIRDIPIEKSLLFRPKVYGNNPEGRSILRTAYVPYYFAKRLQEQEAIMGERMGGVPVVKVPMAMIEAANSGNAKAINSMNSFKKVAVNLRIDEQMGVVFPSDVWQQANGGGTVPQYALELITPTGGRGGAMNFEVAITRYNTNMMTSVLADFLTLGHEARGTQSLAVTKVDLFFQAIEGYLNGMAAIYNRYALPRLFELNGFSLDLLPRIEPDLAQRVDLDVLSNFVLRLSQSGMPLFPNDDLQTFLLDAAGMPDVSDPRALQAAGLLDEQLDLADESKEQQLANAKEGPPKPTPQPGGGFNKRLNLLNLNKMLLASLARRQIRSSGARFGYTTKRRAPRVENVSKIIRASM